MKRKSLLKLFVVIPLALVLVALLFLPACAKEEVAPTPAKAEEPIQLLIGGSGIGGAYYTMACGLMTIINENLPEFRATAISAGSTENWRTCVAGELFTCQKAVLMVQAAWDGKGVDWDYKPERSLQLMAIGHSTWTYCVTLDPEIKTLWDLKGKRVTMCGAGTAGPEFYEAILNGLGFTLNVDYKGVFIGGHDAANALMEGRADVTFESAGMLFDAILEVDVLKPLYFVRFPEDMWDEVDAALEVKGLGPVPHGIVPAELGLYRGLKEDYKTICRPTGVWVHKNADEEIVYKVTRALWENVEKMAKIHEVGKEYRIESVKAYVDAGYSMLIHPGALRYYKEVGLLK